MSVRELEAYVSYIKSGKDTKYRKLKTKSPDTTALEKSLTDKIGLSVEIIDKGKKGGELKIRYSSYEQLDSICKIFLKY